MSAVLKSFNQQLIDDEKNDHYGLRDRKLGSKSYQDASESSSESEEGEDDDEDFVVEKEEESAPEEDSGSDSDDDWATRDSPRKRARNATGGGSARKRARTYQPKWTVKARIRNLATDDDDGARAEVDKAERNLKNVDANVLERIKKALTLAAHEGTGEAEARNAMRMAHKLMQMHNVSQADVMAKESDEQKAKRAGASVVEITSRSEEGEKGTVSKVSWYDPLASAMSTFFNVKCYSTIWGDRTRLTWTFYGLAEGTVAAARAFEWIHNLVLRWRNEKSELKGVNAKNMYCNGVADELNKLAHSERNQEALVAARAQKERLAAAARDEATHRAAELARLAGPDEQKKAKVQDVEEDEDMPLADDDEDSESDADLHYRGGYDDYDDDAGDFLEDDAIDEAVDLDAALRSAEDKVKVKPDPDVKPKLKPIIEEKVRVKPEPLDDDAPPAWESEQQLQLFRNNATAIADGFLKQNSIKLGKGRARARPVAKDENAQHAYNRGREDGKTIEVRRKRIEGAKS